MKGKEVIDAKIEGVYEKIKLFGNNHEYEHQDHLLYNDLNELLKLTKYSGANNRMKELFEYNKSILGDQKD